MEAWSCCRWYDSPVASNFGAQIKKPLGICEDYPFMYFIPRSTTNEFLKTGIQCREQGAFPLLVYAQVGYEEFFD